MVLVGISKRRFLLPALGVAVVAAAVAVGAIVAGTDGGSKRAGSPSSSSVTVSETSDLAVLDLATGHVRLLTDSQRDFLAVSGPAWSPDGRRIAFARRQCRSCPFRLAVAGADGGPVENLIDWREEANAPAWSPTRPRLVFTTSEEGERKLVLFDLRLGRGRDLEVREEEEETDSGHHEEGEAPNDPAFSPDGSAIAFAAEASRERTRIFLFHLAIGYLHELDSDGDHNAYPAFSPSGRSLAFSQTDATSAWDVCIKRLDTGGETCLARGPSNDVEPSWLPDGDAIVFASDRDDAQRLIRSLYMVDVDGTGLRRLTRGFDDGAPAVSPDGTKVAFVRRSIVQVAGEQ
jgi:Tol biopolymer transport system component